MPNAKQISGRKKAVRNKPHKERLKRLQICQQLQSKRKPVHLTKLIQNRNHEKPQI